MHMNLHCECRWTNIERYINLIKIIVPMHTGSVLAFNVHRERWLICTPVHGECTVAVLYLMALNGCVNNQCTWCIL